MSDPVVHFEVPSAIVSPCILVCTLDPASGWCLGCGRSGAEIAAWTAMDDAGRAEVMALLPGRMTRLRAPTSGEDRGR